MRKPTKHVVSTVLSCLAKFARKAAKENPKLADESWYKIADLADDAETYADNVMNGTLVQLKCFGDLKAGRYFLCVQDASFRVSPDILLKEDSVRSLTESGSMPPPGMGVARKLGEASHQRFVYNKQIILEVKL